MIRKLLLGILMLPILAIAQSTPKDMAVRVWAEPNMSNATIELKWEDFGHTDPIKIYKKDKSINAWTSVATLNSTAKSYTITAVDAKKAQEWRVSKDFIAQNGSISNYCNGYIYTGLEILEKEQSGHCLLLISQTAYDSLSTEIGEAMDMVIADGWQTDTMVLSESMSAKNVKAKISTWYNANPKGEKCLFIFGHVAVPYSGLLTGPSNATVPADAHTPDHDGAWVCDAYYADIDGTYTDQGTRTSGNRAANKNLPNDGKWDTNLLPSLAEVQVGRVDLFDIPTLGSEVMLLRRYLSKLKTYKTGEADIPMQALYEDRLGALGVEGPARPAWMYLPPLVGKDNITVGNLISNARANKYIFSHESSTGSYTQYNNIANTSTFNDSFNAVFNSSFGSYFGDWDVKNNILRACIGSPGFSLTNCWNGRPMILFHHMSLGENIGFSIRAMQNNNPNVSGSNTYPVVFMQGRAHQSLIGDPTLRMQMFRPATGLAATGIDNNRRVNLTWTESTASGVLGYNVYHSTEHNGVYKKINKARVKTGNFKDSFPLTGTNHYLVRAVKLDSNASGTFYNQSIGAMAKVDNITNGRYSLPNARISIFPNPTNGQVSIHIFNKSMMNPSLIIKDTKGSEVYRSQIRHSTEIQHNLSAGVYFFTIVSDNFAPVTHKVVKL